MGGMFKKPKKANTAGMVERPGAALLQDLPKYEEASRRATAARLAEIERVMPGATAQRQKATEVTASLMRGEIPRDVQEQTMRSIAEFGGAGFNPFTAGLAGGFQAAQGLVPRQLGATSLALQEQGVNSALAWQQLADTFAYDPFEAAGPGQVSMQYGQARAQAEQRDVAAYNQALGQQRSAIVGGLTGLASIALAPVAAPALFGGLAAGAAGLGLGTAGTASTMGTGLAGSLYNMGASRVGSALVGGAARSIYGR